ncbi:elongation of very long chain fatty acids protein 4-like [Culex pipiens pallens]|uniref:elongation of very long chain fatty acids protein 4-like n=1 Tax=Culex pipiens pallens TaxID=42434 RepID=UPI0019535A6E|nr:elongation of very long chain fatty acids protein 4-like [Culex pipiens pallens]XP_052564115.1 elongation of very long chain fatty acids protein 4-like [Culex pipiens pallens]
MASNQNDSIPFYDVFGYYEWTLTLADPRTKGWPLVDSPVPTLLCVLAYLLVVWVGPKLMRDRKPFDLSSVLIPYNLAMALLNLYICVQLFVGSTQLGYSYICEPCQQSFSGPEMRIVGAVWWYYFSKVLEFMDTFFFILRKKENQLTFLHVYHHSTMFSFWWIGIKWVPSGSTFLPAMVNSFIHVLMYTYYGLSAVGPHMNKYLWWKKYLTILQLIQFTIALVLGVNGIVTGCEFPLWMHYTLIGYMISFIVLFGNFYAQAYIKGHKIKQFEINSNSLDLKSKNKSE